VSMEEIGSIRPQRESASKPWRACPQIRTVYILVGVVLDLDQLVVHELRGLVSNVDEIVDFGGVSDVFVLGKLFLGLEAGRGHHPHVTLEHPSDDSV